MSWLPSFGIGLWNAWILMLFYVLHPLILIIVDKAVGTGGIYKKMGDIPTEKREKRNNTIAMGILFLLIVYSVFLPLKLGSIWFYAGLTIYLMGLLILFTTIVNIATTPIGQVFKKGMYRFSRHPGYFSMSITLIGVSVATASWVFLLISMLYILLMISEVDLEERGCLKTYGDEYQEYMNRTPRWIGIPKSR